MGGRIISSALLWGLHSPDDILGPVKGYVTSKKSRINIVARQPMTGHQ
jgi:hypothetical protein